MVKLIRFLIIVYGLIEYSCFAMEESDSKTQKSLNRVYRVCGYSSKDAETESTHNIAALDTGFDTWHHDFIEAFINLYNPQTKSKEVNQIFSGNRGDNLHGSGTVGVIRDLTPTASIVPVVFGKNEERLASLDYTLNKAEGDIINLSVSLSKGYVAAPIDPNIKDLLIKSFVLDKIIITAVGNTYSPMDELPLTRDLKELAYLSNDKFIIVGGTTPDQEGKEKIWKDGSQLETGEIDKPYLSFSTLGSSYPGKEEVYQKIFVAAPAKHYTTRGWISDCYYQSKEREYFGMTSSAVPVVTSFAERLWTHSPKSNAANIGNAIYNGTRRDFEGYVPETYGEGLVNYKNSLELLKTEEYQSL